MFFLRVEYIFETKNVLDFYSREKLTKQELCGTENHFDDLRKCS